MEEFSGRNLQCVLEIKSIYFNVQSSNLGLLQLIDIIDYVGYKNFSN